MSALPRRCSSSCSGWAATQPVLAPEATGYMLRGFFECLRRHIRHERDLLANLPVNVALN